MNEMLVLMSAMAVASIAFVSFLVYRNRNLSDDSDFTNIPDLEDNSSLEEDLNDIMEFIPLGEVREIIEVYMKYDGQIGETVNFINDQKKFILREFQQIPQMVRFVKFLRQSGLNVDELGETIRRMWKTSPRFIRSEPSMAAGGLTVMISKILKTIPQEELHELLRQKIKYSNSFRSFIRVLRSEDFHEFCNAMENNDVLHHHFFWAKESGIEITFAIELFKDFYVYLTEGLIC